VRSRDSDDEDCRRGEGGSEIDHWLDWSVAQSFDRQEKRGKNPCNNYARIDNMPSCSKRKACVVVMQKSEFPQKKEKKVFLFSSLSGVMPAHHPQDRKV
jgi:hypothetical protein